MLLIELELLDALVGKDFVDLVLGGSEAEL
jgi:hypothetical protein